MEKIGKDHNKQVFQFNDYKHFPIFVDRRQLYLFFNNLLKNEEYQENLKKLNGVTIDFPITLEFKIEEYEQTFDFIEKEEVDYPLLIKTKWAASKLTSDSHKIILVKNKESLKILFASN